MTHQNPSGNEIYRILTGARTIAVVGASANPEKTSHRIMRKLQEWGYETIPVNPNETKILGRRCYAALTDIPQKVDIVNVFRRPEHTPQIAADAVRVGAKVLWLQQGISSAEAAHIASAGGLTVIMDYCIAVAHSMLKVPPKEPGCCEP